jgi:hypothetical protein
MNVSTPTPTLRLVPGLSRRADAPRFECAKRDVRIDAMLDLQGEPPDGR